MWSRSRTRTMMIVALVLATAGCHKIVDKRSLGLVAAAERKASDAAREVEHEPARTSTQPPREDLKDVAEEVRREREDVAEATARERVQYKQRLAKELSAVDKRVSELSQELARATGSVRDDKERDISAARGWRARLKHDLDELERVGESEWPEVRDRIERDIEEERPPVVPRGFEKSFAI